MFLYSISNNIVIGIVIAAVALLAIILIIAWIVSRNWWRWIPRATRHGLP